MDSEKDIHQNYSGNNLKYKLDTAYEDLEKLKNF
jgi:hypothetical protein